MALNVLAVGGRNIGRETGACTNVPSNNMLVRKFVQASIKGLAYSFERHEESVSVIEKMNPQVTKERAIEELLAIKGLWTEDLLKFGLGFMTPERTRISVDSVTAALELGKVESLDSVYSNKFVK